MTNFLPSSWDAAIQQWSIAQQSAGFPQTTIGTRTQHLRHLARGIGIDPWEVTGEKLIKWTGQQKWKTETRRGRRNTFLSFYRWAVGVGHIADNPAEALAKIKTSPPRPRPAPETAWQAALLQADPRESLMLRLASHGLRRAEVAQGHANDLVPDLAGWSLLVHGKGNRERCIPITPELAAALRALPYGYFFPGSDNGHLSPRWVGKLLTNLLPDHWTMHTLRHRFATNAYAVEKDTFTVQELLGHASPNTTRMYVEVPRDSLRRTVLAVAS